MKIDYKQWIINNQTKMKYTVLNFIEKDNKLHVRLRCEICGAIRVLEAQTLYRNDREGRPMHGERCTSYFFALQDEELGVEHRKQFRAYYRYAKDRCTNPNSKGHQNYKGKWGFIDYTDYYYSCWEEYKKAIQLYPNSKLSIDRIDGTKGYEDGNVRFIPMEDNLRNKPNVRPIKARNIVTGEEFVEPSLGMVSVRLFGDTSHATSIRRALKRNGLPHKTWEFTYFD